MAELAEGAGLENRCSVHPSRGFESHPLRHLPKMACTSTVQICLPPYGEMSELAEGARLEIVCVVYSGTEGSNPSLSATRPFENPFSCRFNLLVARVGRPMRMR